MSGGTTEIHRDTEALKEGTHTGPSGTSTTLRDKNGHFLTIGVRVGNAIENVTKGLVGTITSVTETELGITWSS